MKKHGLTLFIIMASTSMYGQETGNEPSTITDLHSFNASTGTFNEPESETQKETATMTKSSSFEADCTTDFFTLKNNGDIQQWSLVNNSITGGQIILNGDGSGLAYCGDNDSPTFYLSRYPDTGINFYDDVDGWQEIPTDVPLLNNGGHKFDQYYMGNNGGNNILHYFDGTNLSTIDNLASEFFSVYDIAVDTLGRAWVFKGNSTITVNNLNVYDSSGLVTSFPISFNSTGTYGSFFLNDTLYVAFSNANSIRPVIITGNVAQLGTPISFQNIGYLDMASCQENRPLTNSISELSKDDINIFPNPSSGVFNLSTPVSIDHIQIYNLNGQVIAKLKHQSKFDLSDLPEGMYFVKIITPNGQYNKKIIKR